MSSRHLYILWLCRPPNCIGISGVTHVLCVFDGSIFLQRKSICNIEKCKGLPHICVNKGETTSGNVLYTFIKFDLWSHDAKKRFGIRFIITQNICTRLHYQHHPKEWRSWQSKVVQKFQPKKTFAQLRFFAGFLGACPASFADALLTPADLRRDLCRTSLRASIVCFVGPPTLLNVCEPAIFIVKQNNFRITHHFVLILLLLICSFFALNFFMKDWFWRNISFEIQCAPHDTWKLP